MTVSEEPASVFVGRVIAAQRVTLGMKRKDLAVEAGLSYPYVAEIENGGKTPSQGALQKIAEALGWTTAELLTEAERLGAGQEPTFTLRTVPKRSERTQPDETTTAYATTSVDPRSQDALVDELRDEVRLLSKRLERMDAEMRDLRTEVTRLRETAE